MADFDQKIESIKTANTKIITIGKVNDKYVAYYDQKCIRLVDLERATALGLKSQESALKKHPDMKLVEHKIIKNNYETTCKIDELEKNKRLAQKHRLLK